jgi:hypothetical protein
MDTSQQAAVLSRDKAASVVPQQQRHSIAEQQRIVEETLASGVSVAVEVRRMASTPIRFSAGASEACRPSWLVAQPNSLSCSEDQLINYRIFWHVLTAGSPVK